MLLSIFIFLLIVIIVISLCIYVFKTSSIVQYVSSKYMKNVINKTVYFNRMSRLDLIARKMSSSEDYKKQYYNGLLAFNNSEKSKLDRYVKDIDEKIIKYKNLSSIDWKFAKVTNDIELGYPHTLEDTIVLSPKFFELPEDQMKLTLLHEKIHIYQRKYPLETEELILNVLDYQIKSVNKDILELSRNNPDINNLNYGKDDYVILQIYNSFSPKNIGDSRVVKIINDRIEDYKPDNQLNMHVKFNMHIQYEHPYEVMACYLPNIILKNQELNEINIKKIVEWMRNYL